MSPAAMRLLAAAALLQSSSAQCPRECHKPGRCVVGSMCGTGCCAFWNDPHRLQTRGSRPATRCPDYCAKLLRSAIDGGLACRLSAACGPKCCSLSAEFALPSPSPASSSAAAAPIATADDPQRRPAHLADCFGRGAGGRVASTRVLLYWPTIPVPERKGSDTRPMDLIKALTAEGCTVDLAFFLLAKHEMGIEQYDDTADRQRLRDVGVGRIIGPLAGLAEPQLAERLRGEGSGGSGADSYFVLVYWTWHNVDLLYTIEVAVRLLKKRDGRVAIAAVCDDFGVVYRGLLGRHPNASMATVGAWLRAARPVDVVASADAVSDADAAAGAAATGADLQLLLKYETRLYAWADVIVGISEETRRTLSLLAPATPTLTLRYVSPVAPEPNAIFGSQIAGRSGFLFVGYKNAANTAGVNWFADEVLPKLPSSAEFHLVGTVSAPTLCRCTGAGIGCESLRPQVVCHGAMNDADLRKLFFIVRASVNPILEPAGVATKTCRSLALGVPVVSTTLDGTFAGKPPTPAGRICKPKDALCFEEQLRALCTDTAAWTAAAQAGPAFIAEHYAVGPFNADVAVIGRALRAAPLRVAVEGDAVRAGESMPSQNWHLLQALSTIGGSSGFELSATSNVNPPIDKVVSIARKQTGYHLNVLIRQGWPPSLDPPPSQHCGPGCRVAVILPWEFGALPRAWLPPITANIDELWAPSRANAAAFFASGIGADRVRVVPCGVDCDGLQPSASSGANRTASRATFTFVFTGGLLPRKGLDVLLEAWRRVFCPPSLPLHRGVLLRMHTNYGLGFDPPEQKAMEEMVSRCGNIEWHRGWLSEADHQLLMTSADVYVAPARAEGFGLPVVEAMALGIPVITTVSDDAVVHAAADDFFGHDVGFPVAAPRDTCRHLPCSSDGTSLCVKPPCRQEADGKWRCDCMELARPASWFEPSAAAVAEQLVAVVANDAERARRAAAARRLVVSTLCWPRAARGFRAAVEAIAGRRRPDGVPDLFVPPILRHRRIEHQRFNRFSSGPRRPPTLHPAYADADADGDEAGGVRTSLPEPVVRVDPAVADAGTRVVISLTTNPVRIHRLEPTITSLCHQTRKPDLVYVTLPYEHRRFRGQPFTVPSFFANFSNCLRLHFMPDLGPATKLLGAVQVEERPETMIVTVDDDKIYSRQMVETLVHTAVANPGAAIGFAGIALTSDSFCFYQMCKEMTLLPSSILEGFAGVLYPRHALGSFSTMRRMVAGAPHSCQLADDVLLSNWLSVNGARRLRVCGVNGLTQVSVTEGGYEDDSALHNLRNRGRQLAWHPEEMRKYRDCFLSGYVDSVAADGLAMLHRRTERARAAAAAGGVVSTRTGSCEKFCYAFNLSSACHDWLQTPDCQLGAYLDRSSWKWKKRLM